MSNSRSASGAGSGSGSPPGGLPGDFTGTLTLQPVLKRNPRGPIYYSPVVDIRVTDRDLRLLSFVIPPADADEIEVRDGAYQLPVRSQCELVLPLDTIDGLLDALAQARDSLRERSD